MDTQHWQKIINNIPNSYGRYIMSRTHSKCNRVHIITARRDKKIVRKIFKKKNLYSIKSTHIQTIGNKIIILPTTLPTPYHIGDVVNSPLIYECLDSIFSYYDNMEKSTTFSALFILSSLPPDTKILHPRISFRVKTTDIDNQYGIYSRTC